MWFSYWMDVRGKMKTESRINLLFKLRNVTGRLIHIEKICQMRWYARIFNAAFSFEMTLLSHSNERMYGSSWIRIWHGDNFSTYKFVFLSIHADRLRADSPPVLIVKARNLLASIFFLHTYVKYKIKSFAQCDGMMGTRVQRIWVFRFVQHSNKNEETTWTMERPPIWLLLLDLVSSKCVNQLYAIFLCLHGTM